jgi:predicted membrane chloride channel (bestrophin family)
MLFVRLYCLGLPLNMVANLGWLTPIGSTIVGFVFLALDQTTRRDRKAIGTVLRARSHESWFRIY